MRCVRALGVLLLGCAGFAAAGTQMSTADIPSCAVGCTTKALALTTCPLIDRACMCADSKFNAAVEICLRSACTVRENLVLAKLTSSQCNFPYQDLRPSVYWTVGIVASIMIIVFTMRMASKAARISKWEHDDTLIVVAFILVIAVYAEVTIAAMQSYWGLDVWVVGPDGLTAFLKMMFVSEMVYVSAIAAIKASILFTFFRIFPGRTFRRAVLATQIFNILIAITWIVMCLAQCQPVSYLWNGWDGEHDGRCSVNLTATGLSHVVVNIGLDVVMLILPITQIYRLQMDFKKKLGAMAMFLLGIFLTIVSCLRVKSLVAFHQNLIVNPTVQSVTAALWAIVELGVGIVVASMPNARHLLQVIFSKKTSRMKFSIPSLLFRKRTKISSPEINHPTVVSMESTSVTVASKAERAVSPTVSGST